MRTNKTAVLILENENNSNKCSSNKLIKNIILITLSTNQISFTILIPWFEINDL